MPDRDQGLIEPIESEREDLEVSLPATYEILTYPTDFTLEILVSKYANKEIRIPPIQRRFVWTQSQSSKLIESFLLGLPVPPIYFYQDRNDNTFRVVDGQQRLKSILFFYSGLFGDDSEGAKKQVPFCLMGLDKNSPYKEMTYGKLKEENPKAFNKLQNSVLRSFVMKQLEPDDDTSIFQIFERLNTGGVVLQGQEIRNCIYEGKFNNLLMKELNADQNWRKIFGTKQPDKRMRDVELILRFLSLFYNIRHYEKPMKKFLNDFMRINRNPSPEKLLQFGGLFTRTAELVIAVLGERPFHIHRGLNAAVFDSVFTAFGREDDAKKIKASGDRIRTRYLKLKADSSYSAWVNSATTDKDVVIKRGNKAQNILFG